MSEGNEIHGLICCINGSWKLERKLWNTASEACAAAPAISATATAKHAAENPGSVLRIPVMPIVLNKKNLEDWYVNNKKSTQKVTIEAPVKEEESIKEHSEATEGVSTGRSAEQTD